MAKFKLFFLHVADNQFCISRQQLSKSLKLFRINVVNNS